MGMDINWLAVAVATLASMVVGYAWYSKAMLGKVWMKLANLQDGQLRSTDTTPFLLAFIANSATIIVLAYAAYASNYYYGNDYLYDAVFAAFWLWLGFTAARLALHDAFELRRKKLTLVNAGHDLAVLLVAAVTLSLIR